MININKLLCLGAVLAIAVSAAGCGSNAKSSEIEKEDSSEAASVSENSASDSNKDSSQEEKSNIGPYLSKTAKNYEKGSYTLKSTITSNSYENDIKLTRVVDGDNIYQLQEEKTGKYGVVSVGEKAYDFDYAAGMYIEAKSVPTQNVIQEVVKQNLPMTDVSEQFKEKGFVEEQYTFTGDTYITNVIFYFDEKSGDLKKYKMRYSIEGQDDIIETRTIDSLSNNVDKSVFNMDFLKKMTNFDSLSEDERLEFCKNVCTKKGITTDMLNEFGLKTDSFKTVDFDTFFNLIYTYSNK